MRTVTAAKFRATCLALMDVVQKDRQPILITKRGKPVAKLIPAEDGSRNSIFGSMKGKVTITGDIISPAFDLDEWEMER